MATALVPRPAASTQDVPDFIRRINDDYKSKIAHVFVLSGNINDFCDDSGKRHGIQRTLAYWYDSHVQRDLHLAASAQAGDKSVRGLNTSKEQEITKGTQRVLAFYSMKPEGLDFAHPNSRKAFEDFMETHYGKDKLTEVREDWKNPNNFDGMLWLLNKWFTASKEVIRENFTAAQNNSTRKKELLFTIVFMDSDALFPNGDIAQLAGDRFPIVNLRSWARDEQIGDRSKVILLCNNLGQIHESIRGGANGVASHVVKKPAIENRETWLHSFNDAVQARTKVSPLIIGQNEVREVNLSKEFDFHQFAVQAAGMNRRQMEDVIMKSWLDGTPVDFQAVRERKQRALEDEYHGIVDFFEPEHGFEQIGGHAHLKQYFWDQVIMPLRKGDRRQCTKGVLMTGPPGTGKTKLAEGLAREAKMNFMVAHLDKMFGGLVGQTESNTRKFMEAAESAAPVIIFMDEIDSILSSGRSSQGDSGTAARVFHSVMTFLSDDSRTGKIVVVAASNRPDLLDAALIRSGRFDAKIPALPPAKGDGKGRKAILGALCGKHQIKFNKKVADTENPGDKGQLSGIGRLLWDNERIWTGAEMEVVLREALRTSLRREHKTIEIEDWDEAFSFIIPNTDEVERMTYLSLLFVDHLGYCPEEYRDLARDKKGLREKLKAMGWEEDEE